MCAADWSSLPPDLVRRLGDHHLATGDIDYYMDMRCVCHSWRSAIPKPRPLGAGADLRFRPRHWVMLNQDESKEAADGRRLFVNVSTGRLLRRGVPMLRDHQLLAASDGLLVVRDKSSPHAIRVLDPFTGSALVRAPDVKLAKDMMTVYFVADPGSQLRAVQFPHYSDGRVMNYVHSKVAHAGHVYVVDSEGYMFRILAGKQERPSLGYGELITSMDFEGGMYLAESAGDLLLIRLQKYDDAAQVYKVDVDKKVLEPVHSIGRRAIFLGFTSCLSIDADKFPSVDPNCLYHETVSSSLIDGIGGGTHRYDLSNDGKRADVIHEYLIFGIRLGPPILAKVLLNYCSDFSTPL